MIVELSGAPGAGKSFVMEHTVVPSLHEAHGAAPVRIGPNVAHDRRISWGPLFALPEPLGRPARWRIYERGRRRHLESFSARNPALVEMVEAHQVQRPESAKVTPRQVLDHWRKACADFELARGRGDLNFVADEGLIHRVVQLFTSAHEPVPHDQIVQYCTLVPLPDRLHFVNSPLEVCLQRVEQRGLWHPWTSMDDLSRYVSNAHEASVLAASVVVGRGLVVDEVSNLESRPVEQ